MSIIVGLIVAGIGIAVAAVLISLDDTAIATGADPATRRVSTNT